MTPFGEKLVALREQVTTAPHERGDPLLRGQIRRREHRAVDGLGSLDAAALTIEGRSMRAYAKAAPGERPPLTKGMFVEIEIRAARQQEHLVVPRSALHDGQLYVVSADKRRGRALAVWAIMAWVAGRGHSDRSWWKRHGCWIA